MNIDYDFWLMTPDGELDPYKIVALATVPVVLFFVLDSLVI